MKFNQDSTKQAQKIIFSKKKTVSAHPAVYFNNTTVNSTATHTHLGMIHDLNTKIIFSLFSTVNKTIGLSRKLQPILMNKSIVAT